MIDKIKPLAYKKDKRRKLMEKDIAEIRESFPQSSFIELAQKFHVRTNTIRYWVDEDFRNYVIENNKKRTYPCDKKGQLESRRRHKDRKKQRDNIYRRKNKNRIAIYQGLWNNKNKGYKKNYYEDNKENLSEKARIRYNNNKEDMSKRGKKYRDNNKEKKKLYYERHEEKIKAYQKKYRDNKRRERKALK